MSIVDLHQLTNEDKRALINYIEGMPDNLSMLIKSSINEPDMDPSLYKGHERVLHKYCTITKYLNTKDIKNVANPAMSWYQSEYATMVSRILDNNKIPEKVRHILMGFVNAKSYDSESICKLEVSIASALSTIKDYNQMGEVYHIINSVIIPYKVAVYDLYTHILLSPDINIIKDGEDKLTRLVWYINSRMEQAPSFCTSNDLPILIYIYFKQFGIETCIEKYELFNRFKYAMIHMHNDVEFVSDIYNKLIAMVNQNETITSAASRLISFENIPKLRFTNSTQTTSNYIDSSLPISHENGMTFLFKNHISNDNGKDIANNIRRLTKDVIYEYIKSAENPNDISFFMSQNDLGHLSRLRGLEIGNAYDSFSYDLRTVGKYDDDPDDYYLFFKVQNKNSLGHIYGISLNVCDKNESRKIIDITRNDSFFYKYISDI